MEQVCLSEPLPESKTDGELTPHRLRITVVDGRALTREHSLRWRELQQSNRDLSSPCFAPEFVQSVALVRDDVKVAVLKQGGVIVGFFPFQSRGGDRGGPVGGIVSDYQGLICRPDFNFDPIQLLKACGLVAWDFDRLLTSQVSFVPFHKLSEPSARIDLSNGYAAYAAQRRKAGTHQLQRCEYMLRRLERDLGRVRFVLHSTSRRALAQVLEWKSEQYRRTGWEDLFANPWARHLLQRIHAWQSPGFAGVLSVLYAGDRLVAGHMGMRSRTVWHYWFPAYDRRFAKYSPGLLLLIKMAQSAEDLELESIDIGTGLSLYKKRLMNSSITVAEGSVERRRCMRVIRAARWRVGSWLKPFAHKLLFHP